MSCPPEDSNGCDGMGNHSYDKILRYTHTERVIDRHRDR